MVKLIITTNSSTETVEFKTKKEAQEFAQIYIKENKRTCTNYNETSNQN